MVKRHLKIAFLILVNVLFWCSHNLAQESIRDGKIDVSLRMIGHEILLNASDSISRVLPIENESGRYKIQFESEFSFEPTELVNSVDSIMELANIAESYLVQIEDCESDAIVHSYLFGNENSNGFMPCMGRRQPKCCYEVYITLMDPNIPFLPNQNYLPEDGKVADNKTEEFAYSSFPLILFLLIAMTGIVALFLRKKNEESVDENLIALGGFQLDKIRSELVFGDERWELTSKEADLLLLLHGNINNVVERENILKKVWGDEGDYVGRTVDVFISKLRKKLESDPNVRIVNARGVGYKLIIAS